MQCLDKQHVYTLSSHAISLVIVVRLKVAVVVLRLLVVTRVCGSTCAAGQHTAHSMWVGPADSPCGGGLQAGTEQRPCAARLQTAWDQDTQRRQGPAEGAASGEQCSNMPLELRISDSGPRMQR